MKNKFVRILLKINGILIPLYILFVLVTTLVEKPEENLEFDDSKLMETEWITKQSSLITIPNSDNYIVAEYKLSVYKYLKTIEEMNLLYSVPKNTFNLIFLDKNFNQKRKLLRQNGSVGMMFIPDAYSNEDDLIKNISHISFYIATEDTNNDGEINNKDQHYVYISDLNGENLIKLTNRKVKEFGWINDNKEISLTYEDENKSEFKYGVYNIEKKTLVETLTIE